MWRHAKHFGLIGCWLPLAATVAPLGSQTLPDGGVVGSLQGTHPVRVHLGLGAGDMGGESGIAARLGVTVATGEHRSITVRATSVEEFTLFRSPAESVWDIGALYGAQRRGKWGYASASAGLALTGGMRRGDRITPAGGCTGDLVGCFLGALFTTVEYQKKPFYTIGFPAEVEVGITLSRHFGLSASGWANLNPERSMTGFTVGLVLGKLR